MLGALGPFDIGQAAVVIDGHVVAVEDIEGTDGLLARVAQLRADGRIRAKAGRGSARHQSAVDVIGLPGDVARARRSQEDRHCRDILGKIAQLSA